MPTKVATQEKVIEKHILPSSLTLGPIDLNVKDIDHMKAFYEDLLELEVIEKTKDQIMLGKGNTPLIILHSNPDLPPALVSQAGLYHFAIVFSSRGDLARFLQKFIERSPQLFSGSADHLVSEAFYFFDPEGNGIELYYDRDRSLWQWEGGHVKMASIYLDPRTYISSFANDPMGKISMGHIHLRVGDIERAKKFYVDILGFDVTAQLPGALFISVGGYHHHIGMNTWESRGAGKREESLGLRSLKVRFEKVSDLELLKSRLEKNSVPVKSSQDTITFKDPWNNTIEVNI